MFLDECLLDGFGIWEGSMWPESCLSSKAGILDEWIWIIILILNLSVIIPVGVWKGIVVSVTLFATSDFDHLFFHLVGHVHGFLGLKERFSSSLMKSPKSGVSSETGILNGMIFWIVLVIVFFVISGITVSKLIGVFLAVVLMVLLSIWVSLLLVKSPESSVRSESSVLNDIVFWVIFWLVLTVIIGITIGELIRVLWVVLKVMFLSVRSSLFLMKSPEPGISSESGILNNIIFWVVFTLVLTIIIVISVGKLIGIFWVVMSMVLFFLMELHVVLVSSHEKFSLEAEPIVLNNFIINISFVF